MEDVDWFAERDGDFCLFGKIQMSERLVCLMEISWRDLVKKSVRSKVAAKDGAIVDVDNTDINSFNSSNSFSFLMRHQTDIYMNSKVDACIQRPPPSQKL